MREGQYLLAICIPTYNRSAYLQACMQSVCTEISSARLEETVVVIISDNNSTDDTRQAAEAFRNRYDGIDIRYSCNPDNVGAVNNFIRLVEISPADFTYILGDDDRLGEGALLETLALLRDHKDKLVFHLKCRQTDIIPKGMPPIALDVNRAGEHYFYNIGNAGTFIFRTHTAQQYLADRKQRIAQTCWPQTEIMFGMLLQEKNRRAFLVSGIELVVSESHDANVVYNSWYILETFCFSLLRVLEHLDFDYHDATFKPQARRAVPACRTPVKFFFRFLLFITHYDYPYEISRTRLLIAENWKALKGRHSFYPFVYRILLGLPLFLKKALVFLYLFISRPAFSRSGIRDYYKNIADYRENKYRIYKEKGKLTADTERYIY